MYKAMTAVAALMVLAGTAQADTVKQIWNQEIGEDNPGRVIAASECTLDDSSAFGCWNEHETDTSDAVEAADEPEPEPDPDEEYPPTVQPPT